MSSFDDDKARENNPAILKDISLDKLRDLFIDAICIVKRGGADHDLNKPEIQDYVVITFLVLCANKGVTKEKVEEFFDTFLDSETIVEEYYEEAELKAIEALEQGIPLKQ